MKRKNLILKILVASLAIGTMSLNSAFATSSEDNNDDSLFVKESASDNSYCSSEYSEGDKILQSPFENNSKHSSQFKEHPNFEQKKIEEKENDMGIEELTPKQIANIKRWVNNEDKYDENDTEEMSDNVKKQCAFFKKHLNKERKPNIDINEIICVNDEDYEKIKNLIEDKYDYINSFYRNARYNIEQFNVNENEKYEKLEYQLNEIIKTMKQIKKDFEDMNIKDPIKIKNFEEYLKKFLIGYDIEYGYYYITKKDMKKMFPKEYHDCVDEIFRSVYLNKYFKGEAKIYYSIYKKFLSENYDNLPKYDALKELVKEHYGILMNSDFLKTSEISKVFMEVMVNKMNLLDCETYIQNFENEIKKSDEKEQEKDIDKILEDNIEKLNKEKK